MAAFAYANNLNLSARWETLASPLGPLYAFCDNKALYRLQFDAPTPKPADHAPQSCLTNTLQTQLDAYFQKHLRQFNIPLAPRGTPFQQRAWQVLGHIPYGHVMSYGAQAAKAQTPKAVRAIGRANAANPIVILIPCHRVVPTAFLKHHNRPNMECLDAQLLGGYGGKSQAGLARKKYLLELEQAT